MSWFGLNSSFEFWTFFVIYGFITAIILMLDTIVILARYLGDKRAPELTIKQFLKRDSFHRLCSLLSVDTTRDSIWMDIGYIAFQISFFISCLPAWIIESLLYISWIFSNSIVSRKECVRK